MNLVYKMMLAFMVFLTVSCSKKNIQSWKVFSADSTVCMELRLFAGGHLRYHVMLDKDTMLNWSSMGIVRKDENFTEGLQLVNVDSVKNIDDRYRMLIGKRAVCRVQSNLMAFCFKNRRNKMFDVLVRVSNDGVAFKYRFLEQDKRVFTITEEHTGFCVPNGKAWMQPYDKVTDWSPAYERYYEDCISSGTRSQDKEGWAFPMLFNISNKWMLISEANTPENYFSAHVNIDTLSGAYMIQLPDSDQGKGVGAVQPSSTLPWETSWRTIQVGKNLSNIFESTLTTDVSDPRSPGNYGWVKPGRAGWSWWSDSKSTKQYKTQIEYIDFAKSMGWEYVLVDANWDKMEGGKVEEVIRYACNKGIGIILWYNSGGPNNVLKGSPRDLMYDSTKRIAEFEKLQKWAVKGVKVDFFQSDKQACMKLYHDIIKDAATYHIMVNFHGCTLPKGWSRTYPNLVGMEAVKGEECYRFDSAFAKKAPVMNTIYPFTRNVVGPMDYTPVAFSDSKFPHKTTFAHELALSVVFENGFLHFADNINAYKNLPAIAKQFLKEVPATWDNSKLVDGYPGKFVVVARIKDKKYYLAGINALAEKKIFTLPLDFLRSGQYNATIIKDSTAKSFACSYKQLTCDDTLKIAVLPYGGFAIKISR